MMQTSDKVFGRAGWTALLILGLATSVGARAETKTVSTAGISFTGALTLPANWPVSIDLPSEAVIENIRIQGGVADVQFSDAILPVLNEAALAGMFETLAGVLGEIPEVRDVRLTCRGELLGSYLDSPDMVKRIAPAVSPDALEGLKAGDVLGLGGLTITIGPSHGLVWTGVTWGYQRPQTCGLGDEIREDLNSIRLMQFLNTYLTQDGATVYACRQLDQADCCNPNSGEAWWKMAAYSWIRELGAPWDIWAARRGAQPGDPTYDPGYTTDITCRDTDMCPLSRTVDDIVARPRYADWVGSDIYIAHHTNAATGSASGTEVYRDSQMEHPAHVDDSLALAQAIKTAIDAGIIDMYDPNWTIRNSGQPRDSAAAFGEIRIPDQPACLVELAFHDNCDIDAQYLVDNYFRSVTQWSIYKGVCDYFGRTPTWDKYSCELVSSSFPTEIPVGETAYATVTFRNRGVLWNSSNGFQLGKVDPNDPLAAFDAVGVDSEVGPAQEHTFTIELTAAANAGLYTTEWQMVRDGQWFGPPVSAQIEITGGGDFNAASLVSDTMPAAMIVGEIASPTVTFENTGTTTWTQAAGYKLMAVDDADPFTTTTSVELGQAESIAPGQQATFTIPDFVAPFTAGTYTSDWRMVQQGQPGFGTPLVAQISVGYAESQWQQTSSLPYGLTDHAVVEYNGHVYCMGGRAPQATYAHDAVFRAPINSDGSIGAWVTLDPLPDTRANHGAVAYDGRLYVWGGWDDLYPTRNTCWYADINPDGSLGAWQTSTVTIPNSGGGVVQMDSFGRGMLNFGDTLYIIGGERNDGSLAPECYYSRLTAGGDYGPWTETSVMPQGIWFHGVLTFAGTTENYMYRVAGNYGGTSEQVILKSVIQPDGSLGAWSEEAEQLPQRRYEFGCARLGNRMFTVGGLYGGTPEDEFFYTSIDPATGAVQPWTTGPNYPINSARMSAVAYETGGSSYLLGVSGGEYGRTGTRYPECYYIEITDDADRDGVADPQDSCPTIPNPGQEDADGDGVGDACDLCPDTIPDISVDEDGCPAEVLGDFDRDGDIDADDVMLWEGCALGPMVPLDGTPACSDADFDGDGDVDQDDFGVYQRCFSGADVPAELGCLN